jgi:3-oxoacyl-[acyl-carrier protein] reductase
MTTGLLAGETALVTGAASGIGRGIATAFAREGARVVLADIDRAHGGQVADALRKENLDARFVPCDLSRPDGPRQLLESTLAALGRLSIFAHSASPRRVEGDTVLNVSDQAWDAMLNVGLRAAFVLGRDVGRHMKEQGIRGRMLLITSLHAESPRNLPHYSATKAGMTMVMKELARAFGPAGIRVNAIAPGAIPGGGFDAAGAGIARLTACVAMGSLGTPEDVAGPAVALVCDRFSSYITGTTVVVDGGLSLHNWLPPPALA